MVTAFERRAMQLEQPFGIDLIWRRSRAYTVDYKTYNKLLERGKQEQKSDKEEGRSETETYLIIDSFCEIEEYDRVSEVAAITRPNILVILSIICFVTGKPLTTFGFHSTFSTVAKPDAKLPMNNTLLELEGEDYSASLTEVLEAMRVLPAEKQTLIYSLLDRWRKGSYLSEENEESYLYEDEAVLACFHILELLGNEYGSMIDTDTDKKVKAFTEEILTNVFFINNIKTSADLSKLIHTTLGAYKTVKPKILRMMKEQGMLKPKSKALIERFLDHRNAIAHGRVNLYEDKAIYPLKPFFTHIKDIYLDIETIRIVSARAIAAFLGTTLWQDEWDDLIASELPTYEHVQTFNRGRHYDKLTWRQLEDGDDNGVGVGVLIHYYRNDTLKFVPFGLALCKYIQELELTEKNAMLVLYVAAILADSTDAAVAARSQELLTGIKDSKLQARFQMRDVLKELAYQGKEPQWLKAFLILRVTQ